jgi:hypothetical protein
VNLRTKSLTATLAGLMTTGMLAALPLAVLTESGAHARMCSVDTVTYLTPRKGVTVWIPTALAAGPWQKGGTQSVTYADGELKATSKGSSDSVGGDAGVSFAVVKASAKYDHTWNRSTTTTTSKTKSYTTHSVQLPKDERSRWTLYHKGYKFPVKQVINYTNGCDTRIIKRTVHVPTPSWTQTNLSWEVQRYSTRNALHY